VVKPKVSKVSCLVVFSSQSRSELTFENLPWQRL